MLLYRGSRQPPREYPVRQPPKAQQSPTCSHCRSSIWNSALHPALKAVPRSTKRFTISYVVSATVLRQSTASGCKWCTTIANGIHGRLYLDRLYEQWNLSDSDISHANDEDKDRDEGILEDESEASLLGEAAEYHSVSVDVDEELETLSIECDFSVNLSFERDGHGSFAFMNAHVESATDPNDPLNTSAITLCGERAVDLCYHLSVCDQSSLNPSRGAPSEIDPIHAEYKTRTLGSAIGLQCLNSWMEFVTDSANEWTDFSSLPGRLMFIEGSRLQVVNTSDLQSKQKGDVAYVALSYVWGTNQSFILLYENEPSLTSSFLIDDVPKTIQDAVFVARELGFQYLWVDALCIMQDSDEDKQRELPKMGKIYRHAALTLVAAVAESALEGFLHVQEQHLYQIDPIHISLPADAVTTGGPVISVSYPADYKRWKDPINGRGWTFQEFLLSSHIAFFSYRGIQMINRMEETTNSGPAAEHHPQLPNLPWMRAMFTLAPDIEQVRQVWLSIRGEYTQRRLGYQQDKLPAISAAAQEIAGVYESKYLAGLWERDLASDLKWCHADMVYSEDSQQTNRPRRMPRSEQYIAPSWSWASVDGPVDDYTAEGGVEVKDWLGFEIIRCGVTLSNPGFEYGGVTGGELVVAGRMHAFFWRPDENPTVDCDGFLAVKTNEEPHEEWKVGEVIVDRLDQSLADGCVVDCLALSLMERIPGREEIECLVLLPAVAEGKYRRVGFGKVSVTALYDDPQVYEICIV